MLAHPSTNDLSSLPSCAFKLCYTVSSLASRRCPFRPLRSIEPFNNATYYCYRAMRTFNFGLIAMLSCIAVIGATPVGDHAPAEATRSEAYVPY
jgi:hypothetical protein